jgi:hypothetical protein
MIEEIEVDMGDGGNEIGELAVPECIPEDETVTAVGCGF